MQPFTFHVVALPHTQTTKQYNACAYTQKVIKFCAMMKSLGHKVYLYASEENEAPCDELIQIVSQAEQRQWFGEYDFTKQFFAIDWDVNKPHWQLPNQRAVKEITARAQAKDFVCLIGGVCQKSIADGLPKLMSVEFGIGYSGVFSRFKIFESYAWMHYVYGLLGNDNGQAYDAVIPNYFDPKDFTLQTNKDDYFLFIGRFIERKGPHIAAEVTRRLGAKLVMAGQGVEEVDGSRIIGKELTIEGEHIKHMGHATISQRDELMRRAKAVFACTTYIEPFGGTSIEPLFCGTPVITTDWGAFTETIEHGKVGYRTRTLGEALWAAQHLDELLPPEKIREYAVANYSMDRIKNLYQAYFEQLSTLWQDGWYSDWDNGIANLQRYRHLVP